MENKDIEQLLKESAEEVKVKDFSERWEKLKGRIDSAQEVELKETASETVLATSVNTTVSLNSAKKKVIISVCAVFLFIAICLAVVLPITLRTNDTPEFFSLQDLKKEPASKNVFYDSLNETDLVIVSLDKYDVSNYSLFYTDDSKVVGGKIDILDGEEGIVASIVFYDSTVTSSFEIGADYKTYNVNGFNIVHKAELTGEYYTINAKASGTSISYELKCFAIDENIESFFQKFFG